MREEETIATPRVPAAFARDALRRALDELVDAVAAEQADVTERGAALPLATSHEQAVEIMAGFNAVHARTEAAQADYRAAFDAAVEARMAERARKP